MTVADGDLQLEDGGFTNTQSFYAQPNYQLPTTNYQ